MTNRGKPRPEIDLQKLIDEQPLPPHPKHTSPGVRELGEFLWAAPLENGIHAGLRQLAPLIAQAVLNFQAGWIYSLSERCWQSVDGSGRPLPSTEDIAPLDDPKFDALDEETKDKALNAMQAFIDKRRGTHE